MNANFNSNNTQIMSSADRCGRTVLGINGSLTSYIMTGDPKACDSFLISDARNQKNTKTQNKINIAQIAKSGVLAAIVLMSGFFLFKNKFKPVDIKNMFTNGANNVKKFFENLSIKFKKTTP